MEVDYAITEKEYVNANKLFTKPSKNILAIYLVVDIALISIALTVDSRIVRFAAIGAVVGGIIGHVLVRHLYAPFRAKRQFRSYQAAQETVHLNLATEALNFKSAIGEATIEWERITKWRENAELILIYQTPEVYHIIPKRIGSIASNLTKTLSSQVGKAT